MAKKIPRDEELGEKPKIKEHLAKLFRDIWVEVKTRGLGSAARQ